MEKIKLHIGCGWRDFGKDWIHVDDGDYEHLDIKCNVTKLDLPDNYADLIYASHVIAYFDRTQIVDVLKEWQRVLKPGGTLRLATPDFEEMARLYLDGKIKLRNILGPMYGRMLMDENVIYHKTVYDFDSLMETLKECEFKDIEWYDWRKTEHSQFDDHSQAYMCPDRDKDNGTLISLNIECKKLCQKEFHIDNFIADKCFINTENKSLFINIPKNASTSIRSFFDLEEYVSYHEIKDIKDYSTFTIIRNPLYRTISSFLEISKCRKDGPSYLTRNMAWYKLQLLENPNIVESFNEYIKELEKGNFYDPHSFPQLKWIEDKNIKIEDIDHVLLYENLDKDIVKLLNKHNKDISLFENLYPSQPEQKEILTDYVNYDYNIQKRIKEIYKRDWDMYQKYKI